MAGTGDSRSRSGRTPRVRIGAVTYIITTHYHVQLGASVHPEEATATTTDGKTVTDSGGRPVERHASTEDEAIESVIEWLEERDEMKRS
jgi:hypothetical protein